MTLDRFHEERPRLAVNREREFEPDLDRPCGTTAPASVPPLAPPQGPVCWLCALDGYRVGARTALPALGTKHRLCLRHFAETAVFVLVLLALVFIWAVALLP